MKIAIRMDDITPDMDWDKFLAFKALLDKYRIRPLVGVVPDNRDEHLRKNPAREDFWAYLRSLKEQGWTIALHGYRHIYTTKKGGLFPLNHFSEFADVPYESQKKMLMQGKDTLEQNGLSTTIFMAPGHTYDKNTLRALKELGFTALTDGFGGGPYRWMGLNFYPISFLMSRSLKKKKGVTTLVVHANEMSDAERERYAGLFACGNHQFISYEEYLRMPAKNRYVFGHIAEYGMALAKRVLVRLRG